MTKRSPIPGFLLLIGMLIPASLNAQLIQHGKAVHINSGGQTLGGVSIIFEGAAPTDTDAQGNFILTFASGFPGDPIHIREIYKKGYELVNREEVELWALSADVPLKLVMAPKGYVDEARSKYYRTGMDSYRKEYIRLVEQISNEKKEMTLSQIQYRQTLDSLNRALADYSQKLKIYTDRFARINTDDMTLVEKTAMEYIRIGDLDAAIKVYEDMDLLERMDEHLEVAEETKENMMLLESSLVGELELLMGNRPEETKRIGDLLELLTSSFPGNGNYSYRYASWLSDQGNRDKAMDIASGMIRASLKRNDKETLDMAEALVNSWGKECGTALPEKYAALKRQLSEGITIMKLKNR